MMTDRERLTRSDFAWAIILGVITASLAWFWGGEGIPSDLWEEISVAAGLRPPTAPFPCVWHAIVQGLFSLLGVNGGLFALRLLGPLALGTATGVGFILLYELVPSVPRKRLTKNMFTAFRAVISISAIMARKTVFASRSHALSDSLFCLFNKTFPSPHVIHNSGRGDSVTLSRGG